MIHIVLSDTFVNMFLLDWKLSITHTQRFFFKKLYMLNIITEYTMVINLSLFIKLNQYG